MASRRKSDHDLNWIKALEEAQQNESSEPRGDGWMTAKEIFKKYGLGIVRGHRYIKALYEDGKLEQHNGAYTREDGKKIRCVWYRPK
jgi:hypothetical protein